MTQLRGIDGAFLHMETPELPMHTLKVLLFSGPVPTPEAISEHANDWLRRVPMLTQRVLDLPLGLGQPALVVDHRFDIERHLRWIHLPQPASAAALDDLVSGFARGMLRRDRPLWKVMIVDGFADGRWAAVIKIHHTLADGAGSVAMLQQMLDGAPTSTAAALDPSYAERWTMALRSIVDSARALPALVARSARTVLAIWQRRRHGGVRPTSIFEAPKLRFNVDLQAPRRFARAALPLGRVMALKRSSGATLNDVLLTVLSGALRRYLAARGELPSGPIVASVPVGGGQEHIAGNDMSSVFTALPCQLSDPAARLRAVRESMSAAKEELVLSVELERAWVELLPPFALGAFMRAPRALGITRTKPPINLVISTVRGPAKQLTVAGRKLESIHSVGPLVANVGLNITVWSYCDELCVGLLAGADATHDLHILVEALLPALAELEAALVSAQSQLRS